MKRHFDVTFSFIGISNFPLSCSSGSAFVLLSFSPSSIVSLCVPAISSRPILCRKFCAWESSHGTHRTISRGGVSLQGFQRFYSRSPIQRFCDVSQICSLIFERFLMSRMQKVCFEVFVVTLSCRRRCIACYPVTLIEPVIASYTIILAPQKLASTSK